MIIRYVKYEFVDEVETLTLAEGPGEVGFIVHLLRATWEDDDDVHEVVNAAGENVLGAVRRWDLDGSRLVLTFATEAAAKLDLQPQMEFELDLGDADLDLAGLRQHLLDILVDVPEPDAGLT